APLADRSGLGEVEPGAPAGDSAGALRGLDDARGGGGHRPPAGNGQEPHLLRAAAPALGARRDGAGSMTDCDRYRELLGGYVLQALEPDEQEEVRRHLESCPRCGREHVELAGVPALLDVLGTPKAMAEQPPPA